MSAKDIEASAEKHSGTDLPSYDGSPRMKSAPMATEVLAGDVFEGHTQTTQRGLKSRHAQMIALGGTIGTGLFVGSGQTLARGGPAFILVCYSFMALMIYCVVTAIVEVATWLPTPGSTMNLFGTRYVSKSLGFALGWLYFYSLGILVPYEITAAAIVIGYWDTPVNIAVWITLLLIVIVALNALPVRFYGETEFWFASTKVIMMLGLLLVSVVLFFGGGPSKDRLGFRYWKDPGAANEYLETGNTGRFLCLLSTLVMSAFPFVFAPEMLVVTGGEMQSPRRNLPVAARRYIYRLIFFYVGCVLAIGVIVPSDNPLLTNGGVGAGASPFVIAMKANGIHALDSVINAGIIISAWSSGNSFLYLSSRSLYAMSLQGSAPRWFSVCTKNGVPYRAVMASSIFTLLAYLNVGSSASVVFNWLVNLSNTSGFISWISCGIIYLRFRKATEVQGIDKQLTYRSIIQPYGTYIQMAFFTFLCLINGFNVFWPENWSAASFLTAYVGIPIFFAIYFGHRFVHRHDKWAHDPAEIDLHTGLERILEEEIPPKPVKHRWMKPLTLLWE